LCVTGADIVFSNNAQITNTHKFDMKSNAQVYTGNSDSGTIINYGAMNIDASPTFHVPLINRGIITLAARNTLTLDSMYTQDIPTAEFIVANDAGIIKSNGPLSIAYGTLNINGNVKSDLNIAGRLLLNITNARIDGDVVFGTGALYSSTGGTMQSSKTVYLAGNADLTGTFDAIQAKQLYNVCSGITICKNVLMY
jgi:hypothetical protein